MKLHLTTTILACSLLLGCGGRSSPRAVGASAAASTASPVTTSTPSPVTTSTTTTPLLQLVSFETIDEGAGSMRGFNLGAHEERVTTDADWAYFWSSHSQAALPAVDFTNQSVVATFMGPMSGGSHTTQIVNVSRDANSDDLHALVREFRLGAWKPNTKNLTSPFHIVRCDAARGTQGTLQVDRQTLLDFETLSAGANSAIGAGNPSATRELLVIRDAAAFSAFYARHQPGARPPGVDFQRSMIVVVLAGFIPSFGNRVETLRLLHDGKSDEIRLVYRVNPYRGGAAPPQTTETPFQILRVSRATGPIREEVRTRVTATPLASGTAPRYTGPADRLVIRDAATFATLWSRRVGTAIPQVDFAVDQVVVVFEPQSTRMSVSVARVEEWEDSELSVRVNTRLRFGPPSTGAPYVMVTTPRTFGPHRFDVINVTPRP